MDILSIIIFILLAVFSVFNKNQNQNRKKAERRQPRRPARPSPLNPPWEGYDIPWEENKKQSDIKAVPTKPVKGKKARHDNAGQDSAKKEIPIVLDVRDSVHQAEKPRISGQDIVNPDSLLLGVIMSEILQPPVSIRIRK